MTEAEMMAMKAGDRYFVLYDDGGIMAYNLSNTLVDRRSVGMIGAGWRSNRFIVRKEAEEAREEAERRRIKRVLTGEQGD